MHKRQSMPAVRGSVLLIDDHDRKAEPGQWYLCKLVDAGPEKTIINLVAVPADPGDHHSGVVCTLNQVYQAHDGWHLSRNAVAGPIKQKEYAALFQDGSVTVASYDDGYKSTLTLDWEATRLYKMQPKEPRSGTRYFQEIRHAKD